MRLPVPLLAGKAAARFWAKVALTPSGCAEWTGGTKGASGYGVFWLDGRLHTAHRLAYTWATGDDPGELDLDHLCRNRRCVAPAHLEPVARRENLRRGEGFIAQWIRDDACQRGHDLTAPNAIRTKGTARMCRLCDNFRSRKADHKKRGVSIEQ